MRLERTRAYVDHINLRTWKEDYQAVMLEIERTERIIAAARLIEGLHDAGMMEWWVAHDKLYAALAAFGSGEGDTA